jgi:hypothetical protein
MTRRWMSDFSDLEKMEAVKAALLGVNHALTFQEVTAAASAVLGAEMPSTAVANALSSLGATFINKGRRWCLLGTPCPACRQYVRRTAPHDPRLCEVRAELLKGPRT